MYVRGLAIARVRFAALPHRRAGYSPVVHKLPLVRDFDHAPTASVAAMVHGSAAAAALHSRMAGSASNVST